MILFVADTELEMADVIRNLPDELKLRIVEQTVLAPKAHFLKPFSNFNGALKGATIEIVEDFAGQVGAQEVSRLSGARILARIHMALRDGEFVF